MGYGRIFGEFEEWELSALIKIGLWCNGLGTSSQLTIRLSFIIITHF